MYLYGTCCLVHNPDVFCMFCNFSSGPRLLLCIVSKAYQASCCACVLINILFFPEFQESSLEFIILPLSWKIQSTPSALLSLLEKQVIKEGKRRWKFLVYNGKEWFELLHLLFFFTHNALQLPWASLVITHIGIGLVSTHPLLSLGCCPALDLKEQ